MLDPHIEIRSLSNTKMEDLVKVFNLAFGDYYLAFVVDENYLTNRWLGTGVSLNHSPGIFINGVLSAFIIIALNKHDGITYSYNAGTGVIPAKRGNRYVQKMYEEFIFPQHRREEITTSTLEAFCQNEKAIKAYQRVGYKIRRKVLCFKTEMDEILTPINSIKKSPLPVNYKRPFKGSYLPSWDNDDHAIMRIGDKAEYWTFTEENQLLAYAVVNNVQRWVCQWGYQNGHEEDLDLLVRHALNKRGKFSALNVDENDKASIAMLERLNFKQVIEQYEMVLDI